MALKEDYKDYISKTEEKKFDIRENRDGTHSLIDVTEYTQVGDTFGARDINETNKAVNELQKGFTHSTSEQITGDYWVDGKPIYKRTVTIGQLINGGSTSVNLSTSNIETCMFDSGNSGVLMSDGVFVPLQQNTTSNTNTGNLLTELRYNPTSNLLLFSCGTSRSLLRANITIRYTKR